MINGILQKTRAKAFGGQNELLTDKIIKFNCIGFIKKCRFLDTPKKLNNIKNTFTQIIAFIMNERTFKFLKPTTII